MRPFVPVLTPVRQLLPVLAPARQLLPVLTPVRQFFAKELGVIALQTEGTAMYKSALSPEGITGRAEVTPEPGFKEVSTPYIYSVHKLVRVSSTMLLIVAVFPQTLLSPPGVVLCRFVTRASPAAFCAVSVTHCSSRAHLMLS